MNIILGSGRVYSGESDVLITPPNYLRKNLGVIHAHGAEGGNGGAYEWMGLSSRWPVMNAVGDKCVTVCADLGGNATWGNTLVTERMYSAYLYLVNSGLVTNGKIRILAQSMGATSAIAFAAGYPTLIDRIVLMIPVINLTDVRNNSGYQSQIDAAYGGTYSEASYGATHNPLTIAQSGKLANIPIQMWYGTSDTLCKPEFAVQFAAAAGNVQSNPIAGGHAESTLLNIDPVSVSNFLQGA